MGQPVIVENRGDAIVQALFAKAPRDLELGFAPVSLAPVGTPIDVIARLNAAISEVVNVAEMKAARNQQGPEPQTNTTEQFGAFNQGEITENAKLIKLIGLKAV